MRGKQLAVILVVAVMIVPGSALGVVRGSPELKSSAPDNRVVAGEDTEFQVTLTNEGNLDTGSTQNPSLNQEVTTARAVEATLHGGEAPVTVKTGTQVVSQLPKGEAASLPYALSVAEDAQPGTYDMELEVEYRYTSAIGEDNGARNEQTETRRFDVTLEVEERADFTVTDTETDVQVGSSGTVAVTMENTGTDTARDATVQLESLNGDLVFGESATASRFVGDWGPNETETIEYPVRATDDAEQQRYAFRATTTFEDSDGVARESDPLSLGVTPRPETSFSLGNVSGDLRVGEERRLQGTITNDADVVARDVVVRLTTENENLAPAERAYSVGTLEPGESADVRYSIEVNEGADAGPRQFSFVAEYRDGDGDARTSDDLVAREYVRPATDTFDVEVADGRIRNGESSRLTVQVTNQGNETLTGISAKLFADSPISADDDEEYVDELGPGESANLTFSVSASGAMPKSYPVSMDFQYDDADGDTLLSNTYRVPVTVTEDEDSGGLPLGLVGGLVVAAVIAIGGYVRLR